MRESREVVTPDVQPRLSASSHARLPLPVNKASTGVRSSTTWTSTSGDLGAMSDTDEIRDRENFVIEYNRLAQKYGVRPLVSESPAKIDTLGALPKRGWWSRTFRRTSSQSTENSVRRQRSLGHVASHVAHPKRDSLKDQDLQGLVRLCGKSFLYLPPEYAPGSLILPTCFRATAQYLVQHAPETRGVFRIPGSVRVVNELYEFYCAEQTGGNIANTVRSPNLPTHINVGVHDVASCFKKFLAGLPGGILGSLSLFDALVAINSQLYCDPEFSRTKQSKIRARLIALAVGSLRSQFRRELICAVFGLLCLLGRAAEIAPREDDHGHPLPTSDLMGYNALGIVFGPLLVGDMLGSHAVKLADPSAGLFLVAESPSMKSKKEKRKSKEQTEDTQQPFLEVDKIHVANDITEMLITNWRDVVRQMRSVDGSMSKELLRHRSRVSVSEDEPMRPGIFGRSSEADVEETSSRKKYNGRSGVEDPRTSSAASCSRAVSFRQMDSTNDALSVKKTRSDSARVVSGLQQIPSASGALTPPRQESVGENHGDDTKRLPTPLKSALKSCSNTKTSDVPASQNAAANENLSPCHADLSPSVRSPSKLTGPRTLMKDLVDSEPRVQNMEPFKMPKFESRRDEWSLRCTSATPSTGRKRPSPKVVSQVNAFPERLQPLCHRDPIITYQAGNGLKILKAPSTMRSQPRIPQVDPRVSRSSVQSSMWRASSRGSASSGVVEEIKGAEEEIHYRMMPNQVAADQIDGTAEFVLPGSPCRRSHLDTRGDFSRRDTIATQASSLPMLKKRSCQPNAHTNKSGQSRNSSGADLHTISPRASNNDLLDIKRGASKVRGLAAMFDSVAKASPFVPTPIGPIQKKRRETARVVSPYTSNPAACDSLNPATSVSTPASLMSGTRISITLDTTSGSWGKKSMIPRRQYPSNSGSTSNADKQYRLTPKSREETRISVAPSGTPSRLRSPSRLPIRKKISDTGSPCLAQLDGSIRKPGSLKLTAQQEVRRAGCYSSSIPQTRSSGGCETLPRLSQRSSSPCYDDSVSLSMYSSSLIHSPSRAHSASSLRDQIRSLRSELSARNEDCAQLRLELEEIRNMKAVNEAILRDGLNRARKETATWSRRAERAERKIDDFECRAMHTENVRNQDLCGYEHRRDEQIEAGDGYSFDSGSDHIDVSQAQARSVGARMNQGIRRAKSNTFAGVDGANCADDEFSECSSSTVVRNTSSAGEDDGATGSGLWSAEDEDVSFPSPGLMDEYL